LKLYSKVIGLSKRHENAGFQNFIVSKDNETQLRICKDWDGSDSIFLTGNPGTGKTHLAISMLRNYPMQLFSENDAENNKEQIESYMQRETRDNVKSHYEKMIADDLWKYRNAVCLFVPLVEMFIELNESAQKDEGKKKLLDKYATQYDCICFDDFGAEKLSEAKRENFYYIIDKRYRDMRSTIITSNFTIKEINEVEPRIASRFAEMGRILQFNGNDFRRSMDKNKRNIE